MQMTVFYLQENFNEITNGSIFAYTIIYSDSTSGGSCGSTTIPSSSCVGGICNHVFEISSASSCPPSTGITVAVLATNMLGNGPPSDPVHLSKSCFIVL